MFENPERGENIKLSLEKSRAILSGTWLLLGACSNARCIFPKTALHQKVTTTFLPTAIKFHYLFNLRDLSNIFQVVTACLIPPPRPCRVLLRAFSRASPSPQQRSRPGLTAMCLQGLLFSTAECLKNPIDLVRLWLHEAERVYGDKLIDEKDQESFGRVLVATCKKHFDVSQAQRLRPVPVCHPHHADTLPGCTSRSVSACIAQGTWGSGSYRRQERLSQQL